MIHNKAFSVPQCTVVITIGRNVADQGPMPDAQWRGFVHRVWDLIENFGGTIVLRPHGTCSKPHVGVWNGVTEAAAAFMAFVPAQAIHGLKEQLIDARKVYHQEAIGFIHLAGTEHCV